MLGVAVYEKGFEGLAVDVNLAHLETDSLPLVVGMVNDVLAGK